PVIDGSVIAPEGNFEIVVEIVADDEPLDLRVEAGGGRRTGAGVGSRGHADLAKYVDFGRQGGAEMQRELAFLKPGVPAQQGLGAETTRRPMQVCSGEVEVAETGNFERWIGGLRELRHGRRVVRRMGSLHRRRLG